MRSLWNCTWVSRYVSPGSSWKMRAMDLPGLLPIIWNKNFYWYTIYIWAFYLMIRSYGNWEKACLKTASYKLQKYVRPVKEMIAHINHYYLICGLCFIKSPSDFHWAHVWQRCNLLHFKNPLVQNRNVIILSISGFYWAINSVLLSKWLKTLGICLIPVLIGSIREKLEGSYSTSISPYDSFELNSQIRIKVCPVKNRSNIFWNSILIFSWSTGLKLVY